MGKLLGDMIAGIFKEQNYLRNNHGKPPLHIPIGFAPRRAGWGKENFALKTHICANIDSFGDQQDIE